MLATMEDLIHITGPLTEDAILRVLQARFYKAMHYVSTNASEGVVCVWAGKGVDRWGGVGRDGKP